MPAKSTEITREIALEVRQWRAIQKESSREICAKRAGVGHDTWLRIETRKPVSKKKLDQVLSYIRMSGKNILPSPSLVSHAVESISTDSDTEGKAVRNNLLASDLEAMDTGAKGGKNMDAMLMRSMERELIAIHSSIASLTALVQNLNAEVQDLKKRRDPPEEERH